MCLHVAIPSAEQILEEAPYLPDFEQPELFHVNGFAAPAMPLQLSEEPGYLQPGYWSLMPHWVTDPTKFKAMTFNAVGENIFETASYKSYIKTNRALLWVSGFYEFQHRNNGKKKVPYFIYMPGRKPFTLGCVYSQWQDKVTFSIITTPANALMAQIHNSKERMPFVVLPENRGKWLSDMPETEIRSMMQVLPDGVLQAHTVTTELLKRGYESNQVGTQAEVPYDTLF